MESIWRIRSTNRVRGSRRSAAVEAMSSAARVEREAANRVGVEKTSYVVTLDGPLPLERGEIEQRVGGPARQEREDVAKV